LIDTALASLNIDEEHVAESRRFGNRMLAAVERWQVGRDIGSGPRRLEKRDASRALSLALANLKAGESNSLFPRGGDDD
jgi:hypothetical protein